MIPDTKNGLPAMASVSAMQKCIRRGMEREAMEFAVELIHTSKAFHSMVCKRLEIISHEDIDTQADPAIVPFVATAVAQAMKWYDAEKLGASRLAIGNAIRLMCRAAKSREGDHFAAAIGLRAQLEGFVPTIPDWANDQHTLAGRKLGRGLDHFRKEGARLIPPPTEPDPYEDEAYRLWALKQQGR
jgi:replication-associated recombination protein RarA